MCTSPKLKGVPISGSLRDVESAPRTTGPNPVSGLCICKPVPSFSSQPLDLQATAGLIREKDRRASVIGYHRGASKNPRDMDLGSTRPAIPPGQAKFREHPFQPLHSFMTVWVVDISAPHHTFYPLRKLNKRGVFSLHDVLEYHGFRLPRMEKAFPHPLKASQLSRPPAPAYCRTSLWPLQKNAEIKIL